MQCVGQVRQATLKCVIKFFVMICDKISTIRSQFNAILQLCTVQLYKTLTRMTHRYLKSGENKKKLTGEDGDVSTSLLITVN